MEEVKSLEEAWAETTAAASVETKPEGEVKPQPEVEKLLVEAEKKVETKPEEVSGGEAKPEDFEQKWKSVQGIVKHKDGRIAELEQELERTRTAKPAEPAKPENPEGFDIRAEKKKYLAALSTVSMRELELDEGDAETRKAYDDALEAALAIEERIDSKRRETYLAEAEGTVSDTLAKKVDDDAVSTAVAEAYKEYPFLDPKSENANPYAAKLAFALGTDYVQAGMSRAEAIARVAAEVGPMFKSMPVVAIPPLPGKEAKVNEEELKSMTVVKGKSAPVAVGRTPLDDGDFETAWARRNKK